MATTDATVPDTAVTETIHRHLARRGLLPAEHYLDAGHSSAELIVAAREQHQINLVAPLRTDNSVQARTRNGYDRTAFTIGWERRQVTCPQGQASASWTPCRQKSHPMTVAAFPHPTDVIQGSSHLLTGRSAMILSGTLVDPEVVHRLLAHTSHADPLTQLTSANTALGFRSRLHGYAKWSARRTGRARRPLGGDSYRWHA
ncbi:hypothetical protein ACFPOI_31270 [Nonomuraea angiospora]|uniref:Uncharacterized protein n=1 Tax=Nonomuraea angiospora TaxID=46172 RepID=A0ABR9LPY9_9ACTN|nr:hypothetical protein [Nonomuraea angiospora]MBE1582343.1 hypothetical protein [Nonomuraea angiospora]